MVFIVLDGIDGCGKTTIAKLLAAYLRKNGRKVVIMHEPSSGSTGRKIKELIRKDSSRKFSRSFWVTLFTQDRLSNIEHIKAKLEKGFDVISDRYYYSTLAYQLNESEWSDYLKKYKFLKPDVVFILDVASRIGLERTRNRKKKITIFEKLKFLEKVRRKFIRIYKNRKVLNENIYLIDANQPLAKVFSDVKKITDNYYKKLQATK